MFGIDKESVGIALDALRHNKIRAALTMLGVIIGSACIVLVVTISLLGKHYVMQQIQAVGANLVYAGRQGGLNLAEGVGDEINAGDLEAVRHLPHVSIAAGTHDMGSSIVINGVVRPVALVGVTPGFQEIRNLQVMRGRYFDDLDLNSASKACLITQELAKRFPGEEMIGRQLKVGDMSFTVIGVFRERIATFGQSEISAESILIPFPLVRYYSGAIYLKTLYAQADSGQNVNLVTTEVADALRERHRAGAHYTVSNLAGILDAARNISLALTIVLLLVGCIALIISGVGIMNIMLVTVSERTREIGLRKAVGARRRQILQQFLVEAFIISSLGAIVGVLAAVALKLIAQPLIPAEYGVHIPISWWSILAALAVSCSTGVLFGYLPAARASKLPPTESLRHE